MSAKPPHLLQHSADDLAWTPRQREVLDLLAKGLTNREIAERLGISLDGAKYHVSETLSKLGTNSRNDAAEWWRQHNGLRQRVQRALVSAPMVRWLVIGTATAGMAGIVAVIATVLIGQGNDQDAVAPETTVTPPADAVTNSACEPDNLTNGFLVLGQGEPVPDCVDNPEPLPDGQKLYELDVPPGPYSQTSIDDPDRDGSLYTRSDTGEPAVAVYRSRSTGLPGRVVHGRLIPTTVSLPGHGLTVERQGSVAVWWIEDDVAYGIELFGDATGLNLEQAVALLVFFSSAERSAVRWDPALDDFIVQNRPPWTYPDDTNMGVALVDDVLPAVLAGDSLLPFVDLVLAPCVADPAPQPLLPPLCSAGQPEGTLVPAYLTGGCPDPFQWSPLEGTPPLSESERFWESIWLYGIVAVDETPPRNDLRRAFHYGRTHDCSCADRLRHSRNGRRRPLCHTRHRSLRALH